MWFRAGLFLGDVYHPDFLYGKPAYFDVTVHNPLQDSLLSHSAVTAGLAASRGRWRRMLTMRRQCWELEEFSLASLNILRDIAVRATYRSGTSATVAFHHFVVSLFVTA